MYEGKTQEARRLIFIELLLPGRTRTHMPTPARRRAGRRWQVVRLARGQWAEEEHEPPGSLPQDCEGPRPRRQPGRAAWTPKAPRPGRPRREAFGLLLTFERPQAVQTRSGCTSNGRPGFPRSATPGGRIDARRDLWVSGVRKVDRLH